MPVDRFLTCLSFVLKAEGGFVDDPEDPGGATNLGVTAKTLADYLGHPVTTEDMKALTPIRVQPLYEQRYWAPIQGDKLPPGLDVFLLDTAVNMGVHTAAKMLQGAVGVDADGEIGPKTLAAPAMAYPRAVIQKLNKAREGRYRSLPTFPRFGAGWLNRLASVTAVALKDAAA